MRMIPVAIRVRDSNRKQSATGRKAIAPPLKACLGRAGVSGAATVLATVDSAASFTSQEYRRQPGCSAPSLSGTEIVAPRRCSWINRYLDICTIQLLSVPQPSVKVDAHRIRLDPVRLPKDTFIEFTEVPSQRHRHDGKVSPAVSHPETCEIHMGKK